MKFHWGDNLNRDTGQWNMTPNDERWHYWVKDCADLPADRRILTITRDTTNIGHLTELNALEELTLHETNQGQIDRLRHIRQIKRLRITHARAETLDALAQLPHVEELVLEYVSGFDDLSPLAEMPALRAVHLENLRRVNDFSPLGDVSALRYLAIMGTLDWAQPIQSLAFTAQLNALRYLSVNGRLTEFESARAIAETGDPCVINLTRNLLPLEEFAFLEANCANATFQPVFYWPAGKTVPLPEDDFRAELSDKQITESHPEVILYTDGRHLLVETTERDSYTLLGRGARDIAVTAKNASEKVDAFKQKYAGLVAGFRDA